MHRNLMLGATLALSMVLGGGVAAGQPAAPAADTPLRAALVGTWRLERARPILHITFGADGTYRAISPEQVFVGHWAIVEGSQIATWSDPAQPRRLNGFSLDGDSLVIVDRRGVFHKHRRVTPNAEGGDARTATGRSQ